MPEPNLPPLRLRDSSGTIFPPDHVNNCGDFASNPNVLDVSPLRESMPEMPAAARARMADDNGVQFNLADIVAKRPRCAQTLETNINVWTKLKYRNSLISCSS